MLLDFDQLDIFHQGIILRDAGVSNNGIEVRNPVLLLELLRNIMGVLFNCSIILDNDQTASLTLR